MDRSRLSVSEITATLGGVVLLAAMFFDWYSGGGGTFTVWEAFEVLDFGLLISALVAVLLLIVTALFASPALPLVVGVISTLLGFLSTLAVIHRILIPPDRVGTSEATFYMYVALAASVVVVIGSWMSIRRENGHLGGDREVVGETRPAPRA